MSVGKTTSRGSIRKLAAERNEISAGRLFGNALDAVGRYPQVRIASRRVPRQTAAKSQGTEYAGKHPSRRGGATHSPRTKAVVKKATRHASKMAQPDPFRLHVGHAHAG